MKDNYGHKPENHREFLPFGLAGYDIPVVPENLMQDPTLEPRQPIWSVEFQRSLQLKKQLEYLYTD